MISVICIIILPLNSVQKNIWTGNFGNWKELFIWPLKLSEMEECKGKKKKRLFRQIACSARTSKVTHYIRTVFLKAYAVSDVSERDRVLHFSS